MWEEGPCRGRGHVRRDRVGGGAVSEAGPCRGRDRVRGGAAPSTALWPLVAEFVFLRCSPPSGTFPPGLLLSGTQIGL